MSIVYLRCVGDNIEILIAYSTNMNKITKRKKTSDRKRRHGCKVSRKIPVGVEKKKIHLVEQEARLLQRSRATR